MIFWISILVGAGFAWLGVKKRFFYMWALLFNLMVALYTAVMITPSIYSRIADLQSSEYNIMALMLLIGLFVFVCMYFFSNRLLVNIVEVTFPRLFDNIGAGVIGFFCGFLISSIFFFIIYTMPFSENEMISKIIGRDKASPLASVPVQKSCQIINTCSMQVFDNTASAIDFLITKELPKPKKTAIDEIGEQFKERKELIAGDPNTTN